MPNKRDRNDIHVGDRVRLEHTTKTGIVLSEEGPEPEDIIKVRMEFNGPPVSARRKRFVPVIEAATTIFPVTLKDNKIHAAFVMDYRTDNWATMCGKDVPDPTAVVHKVTEVTCRKCADNLRRR